MKKALILGLGTAFANHTVVQGSVLWYVQVYLIITLSLGSIGTDRVISETVL